MQQALREKDRALADAQAAAEQARDEAKAARSAHAVARAQVTSQHVPPLFLGQKSSLVRRDNYRRQSELTSRLGNSSSGRFLKK